MENTANSPYYDQFQHLSDEELVNKYLTLAKQTSQLKGGNPQFIASADQLFAVSKLCEERNINVSQQLTAASTEAYKKENRKNVNELMSNGVKALLIGIVIAGIGLALTVGTNGRGIFYGAIIIGAIKILQGLVYIISGSYARLRYHKKF
ncbi:MAG: hypothetical protein AAFV25_27395 [Bacteroidota bacterium]